MLLLQSLTPEERAVFLLREVFDYDYADIASFIGKSEEAAGNCSAAQKSTLPNIARASRPRWRSISACWPASCRQSAPAISPA